MKGWLLLTQSKTKGKLQPFHCDWKFSILGEKSLVFSEKFKGLKQQLLPTAGLVTINVPSSTSVKKIVSSRQGSELTCPKIPINLEEGKKLFAQ